jgi:hypothetical protein
MQQLLKILQMSLDFLLISVSVSYDMTSNKNLRIAIIGAGT